jgi:hypothetical protein
MERRATSATEATKQDEPAIAKVLLNLERKRADARAHSELRKPRLASAGYGLGFGNSDLGASAKLSLSPDGAK